MFALTAALLATALGGTPADPVPQQAAVRLSLNDGGDYRPGDRVQVEVETGDDGYLVVFRVDGDGYVRVVFPLDPDLDPYVRGDRRYELRGRGERQSFLADDRGGTGLVMAVLSRGPLDFSDYAVDAHWDYDRLRLEDPSGDAEAQLLAIARQMTRGGRFDYDIVGYRVWGPGYESERPVVVAGGGDPYFDPSFACLACGWGSPRTGIHISIGDNWGWYDRWYDPWYDPWYRGYNRYDHWNGWWGWDPYWGTPWRPITVINTRPRPVVPDTPYGLRSRPRLPGTAQPTGTGVPRLTDPVSPAPRPVGNPVYDGRSRSRGTASTPPSAAPSTGRVTSPPSRQPGAVTPSRGGSAPPPGTDRSRARRPETERPAPTLEVVRPSTETRRVQEQPVVRPSTEPRRVEERPVYRPPVETPRVERRPDEGSRSRPASSAPPRTVERPAPSRTVERSSPPPSAPSRSVERSSPPPSAPSRSVERSSPPSSGGASSAGSSSSRSRSRGNN